MPAEGSMNPVDFMSKFLTSTLAFTGVAAAVLWIQRSRFAREFERAVTRRSGGEFERELRRIRKIRGFDVYLVVGVGFRVSARIANDHCSIL